MESLKEDGGLNMGDFQAELWLCDRSGVKGAP